MGATLADVLDPEVEQQRNPPSGPPGAAAQVGLLVVSVVRRVEESDLPQHRRPAEEGGTLDVRVFEGSRRPPLQRTRRRRSLQAVRREDVALAHVEGVTRPSVQLLGRGTVRGVHVLERADDPIRRPGQHEVDQLRHQVRRGPRVRVDEEHVVGAASQRLAHPSVVGAGEPVVGWAPDHLHLREPGLHEVGTAVSRGVVNHDDVEVGALVYPAGRQRRQTVVEPATVVGRDCDRHDSCPPIHAVSVPAHTCAGRPPGDRQSPRCPRAYPRSRTSHQRC